MVSQVVRTHDVAVHVVHVNVLGQVEGRRVRGKRVVGKVAVEGDPVDDAHPARVEDREPGRRSGERHADDEALAVAGKPLAAGRRVRRRRNAPRTGEVGPRNHGAAADAHALDRGAVTDRNGDVARLAVVREHAEPALRDVARAGGECGGSGSEKDESCKSCNETVHGDPLLVSRTSLLRPPKRQGSLEPRCCFGYGSVGPSGRTGSQARGSSSRSVMPAVWRAPETSVRRCAAYVRTWATIPP